MDSVFPVEPGTVLPPVTDLLSGRPAEWLGMPVVWAVDDEPVPVFVRRFGVPEGTDGRDVFLFGARYDLAEAEVGGKSLAPGHFVEFFVVTRATTDWRTARLLNRRSATYSATEETQDYVSATDISDPALHSLKDPPRWAARSEALWPTADGTPMTFVSQVTLPKTPVTETKLTWNATLYLFWSPTEAGSEAFKLVQQDPTAQSAEDHYADEERRWATGP